MVGKDKGKTGKILRLMEKDMAVAVEGLNLYKKHVRPKRQGEKGETIHIARPVSISNVMLMCMSCKRPARLGYRIEESETGGQKDRTKRRYCKRCQHII